jgi:hypothetical protein
MSDQQSVSPISSSALACALSADDQQLREQDVAALFQQAARVRELPDGYAFAFPAGADSAHALLDFIVAERACCPFFTFELSFAAPHKAIWLTLKGEEGVKAMLAATFPDILAKLAPTSDPRDASVSDEA